MKHLYKAALLAALGLASVTAAQAQDMLLGFNDAGANTSAASYQNDYVIDLGALTQFTKTSTYSGSIVQSTFDTAFSSDANWANDVAVGAVGGTQVAIPHQIYVSGTTQPVAASTGRFGNILSDTSGIAVGEYGSAAAGNTGWSYLVGVNPGGIVLDGNTLNTSGQAVMQQGVSPLSFLSGGDATFNLYEALSSGSTHAYTDIGSFSINANNGVDTISFTGASVVSSAAAPEPTTYGLMAGVGLLGLALRRQFASKVA